MNTTTKKLPVRIDWPGGRTYSDHLVVPLDGQAGSGFQSVKSGDRIPHGMITYLGSAVTVEEILTRYLKRHTPAHSRQRCRALIERFVAALERYRVGNVLSIVTTSDGFFTIQKEAERPVLGGPDKKLP